MTQHIVKLPLLVFYSDSSMLNAKVPNLAIMYIMTRGSKEKAANGRHWLTQIGDGCAAHLADLKAWLAYRAAS